jgi:endonuclease III
MGIPGMEEVLTMKWFILTMVLLLSSISAWAGEYKITLTASEESMIFDVNKLNGKQWVEALKKQGLASVKARNVQMMMDNVLRKKRANVPLSDAEKTKLKKFLGLN